MGKPSAVNPPKPQATNERARWPFDPLQPGDHEPARLPEELERVQKQTGGGRDTLPEDKR
ncbi:MAG: hypothetical protein JF611_04415 [Betaproteobacteria bacterium]|jgi:hypothetical protein|nr:hypothetical protein [Betaproteobacteria bacterium]